MDIIGNTWTDDDILLVEKFIEIKNRGYYVSGEQLTEAYNRILHKNVNVTNCGSCLRGRVQELENALRAYRKSQEALKTEEPISDTPEENNKPVAKKVGRPKKN